MGFLSILFGPALLVFILVASLVFLFGAENQTANETRREPAGPRQRPRVRSESNGLCEYRMWRRDDAAGCARDAEVLPDRTTPQATPKKY